MNIISYDIYANFNKNGSCRRGEITTTYDTLRSLFGRASFIDPDPEEKVSCEWILNVKVEDGDDYTYEQVSIYAWKYGCIPTEECIWNIGGFNHDAPEIVEIILDNGLRPEYNESGGL